MASDTVDENAVYMNTGNPLPQDISTCAHWLLNEPFTAVFEKLSEMQVTKGLALLDIVQELHRLVHNMSHSANVMPCCDIASGAMLSTAVCKPYIHVLFVMQCAS